MIKLTRFETEDIILVNPTYISSIVNVFNGEGTYVNIGHDPENYYKVKESVGTITELIAGMPPDGVMYNLRSCNCTIS